MPDPKKEKSKEKPKEKPAGWNLDPIEAIILLLLISALIPVFTSKLFSFSFFNKITFFGFSVSGALSAFWSWLKSSVWFFKALGFGLAGLGLFGTFIFNQRASAIARVEKAKVFPENMEAISSQAEPPKDRQQERWQNILKLSESTNTSDWRLSIIEADIMLDELLNVLRLPGETMGDKLKAVEPSDFLTIEAAWEAHKFRNMIAHEGSDFLVNQREIRRIISLYESVFKEFQVI